MKDTKFHSKHLREAGTTIMRCCIMALILCAALTCKAQSVKERRVYYLDCSYSMETKKLWKPVTDNLKRAIDAIDDENTEIMVIPFAFDTQHHSDLKPTTATASKAGKGRLKKAIDAIKLDKQTNTFHSDPIKDFYANRILPKGTTYMFLMTDGDNEESKKDGRDIFLEELRKWNQHDDKQVYGFYVMLDGKNDGVKREIEKLHKFWYVQTADININLIRFDDTATYNIRNETCFYINLCSGNVKGKKFTVDFPRGTGYTTGNAPEVIGGNKLRVNMNKYQGNVYTHPDKKVCTISISMQPKGKFDVLVTDHVNVSCLSKKERSLKITIQ